MCDTIKNHWMLLTVLLVVCSCVSSCIKYHKTLPTEFPQGVEKQDFRALGQSYVRSKRVYDAFETRALFDALWMSYDVRLAYADLYCKKRGKTAAETEAFLTRQLEENNHWISLYVLAEIREKYNISLSDKNALWTFYLETKHGKVVLESIKEVELEPELQLLFGAQFNYFKTAYLLKFPVLDANNKQILSEQDTLTLVIESVDKKVALTWAPSDKKAKKERVKAQKHEDFYWG